MNSKDLILFVLAGGSATGYDIKKRIETEFSIFMDVSASGTYPALTELARSKLVCFERIEQESRPAKKLYRITEKGRDYLSDILLKNKLNEIYQCDALFLISLAEQLPRERILSCVDEMLRHGKVVICVLEDRLANAEECGRSGMALSLRVLLASVRARNEQLALERANFETLTEEKRASVA